MQATLERPKKTTEQPEGVLTFKVPQNRHGKYLNIANLIIHDHDEWVDGRINEQNFTDMGEILGTTYTPYTMPLDHEGRPLFDPKRGITASGNNEMYFREYAQRFAAMHSEASVVAEHAHIYHETSKRADRLAPELGGFAVFSATFAPDEKDIPRLNGLDNSLHYEVGKVSLQMQFFGEAQESAELAEQAVIQAVATFIEDATREEALTAIERVLNNREHEEIITMDSGVAYQINNFDEAEGFAFVDQVIAEYSDLKSETTGQEYSLGKLKSKNNGMRADDALRDNPEAMSRLESISELEKRLAKEVDPLVGGQRASEATKELISELMKARRDDGTPYLAAEHRGWAKAIVEGKPVEFTIDMAAELARLHDYHESVHIKVLVNGDTQAASLIDKASEQADGGYYGAGGVAINSLARGGCPGTVGMQNADLANMTAEQRAQYESMQRLKASYAKKTYNKWGVCRSRGRVGCKVYVTESDQKAYRNAAEELAAFDSVPKEGGMLGSISRGVRRWGLKLKEVKALKELQKETNLGGCHVCEECERANTLYGTDLSRYSQ